MDPLPVRTEVFWREDIQSILRAIDCANASLAAHVPVAEVAIYRAGFAAALQAVATSFGVDLDPAPASAGAGLRVRPQPLPPRSARR